MMCGFVKAPFARRASLWAPSREQGRGRVLSALLRRQPWLHSHHLSLHGWKKHFRFESASPNLALGRHELPMLLRATQDTGSSCAHDSKSRSPTLLRDSVL
jgi:hypothetical protein